MDYQEKMGLITFKQFLADDLLEDTSELKRLQKNKVPLTDKELNMADELKRGVPELN